MRETCKRIPLRIFVAAGALAAMIASCAKQLDDHTADELARKSFDAWVAKNAPNAVPYKDVYIEFIERGPENAARPVLEYTWLRMDYTGRQLSGILFVSRDSALLVDRMQGPVSSTHYCDDFVSYSIYSSKFGSAGLRTAFEELRVGDSVRIYIPQDQTYTSNIGSNSAYLGEGTYVSLPIMFDVRLKDVISEPYIWERDSVARAAQKRWGNDYVNDTVGLYIHILEPNPDGNELTEDSSVFVSYAQYFLDGFLVDTNIDSIARNWDRYDDSATELYDSIVILPLSAPNVTAQKVLYLTVPHMRKGEWAEVITMSTWSFGNEGSNDNIPEIQAYQPMLYRIYVHDNSKEEEEEEEDE